MADDNNQRPYRGNDASQRIPSGAAPANDPLAELARLIGQNDPFSEFGRDGSKRATAPRQAEPAPGWAPEPAQLAPPAPQPAQPYGSPDFTRQSYGSAPVSAGSDLYHVDRQTPGYQAGYQPAAQPVPSYGTPDYEVPGYGAPGYDASGFPVAPANGAHEQDPFQPQGADDDYYDDVPPSRRRIGILAIAGVFALAVIGTAGAFGYRAIFGSSSVSSPPPVIKAEQTPSKIVPAASSKDGQSSKLITERVNDRAPGERLVSREEQPVVVTTTNATPAQPTGSGVVGSEPKRIRTIAIKPDQPTDAGMPPPVDSIPAPTAQPRVISTTPQRPVPAAQAPAPIPAAAPTRLAAPAAEPEAARAAPAPRAEAPASANAPLSLNPNAAPARAAAPQRAAAVSSPPAAASSGNGVYAVQVSAQRSEEEAQAAFRSLQAKFPGQLGNRQPLIKRVDLGEKGIFFRALVGPFTDSAQASQMCASLKSAGGSCLVQKN